MDTRVEEFLVWVSKAPGVAAKVDRPDDPAGVSFIDIRGPSSVTQVSFWPSAGFGIFTSSDVFGQRPAEVVLEKQRSAF